MSDSGDDKSGNSWPRTLIQLVSKRPLVGATAALSLALLFVVSENPKKFPDLIASYAKMYIEKKIGDDKPEVDVPVVMIVDTMDRADTDPSHQHQHREITFPSKFAKEGTYRFTDSWYQGNGNVSRRFGHNGTIILTFYPNHPEGMGIGAIVLRPQNDAQGEPLWYSGFSLGHECLCGPDGSADDGPFTVIPAAMNGKIFVPSEKWAEISRVDTDKLHFPFPDDLRGVSKLQSVANAKDATAGNVKTR